METTAQILVNEDEASRLIRVCPKTLFNMRRDGQISFVRARGRILYRVSALEEWAKANEQLAVAAG